MANANVNAGGNAPIQLGQAQFDQLLERIGGGGRQAGRKVTQFSSGSPSEWMAWKKHFKLVSVINGWNDERQRRELAASMSGEAALACQSLQAEPNPAPPGWNIDAMLVLYEGKFLPLAESDLAVAAFESCHQANEDTVIIYDSKLRERYARAYPGRDVENDRVAINQFIRGLKDREVTQYVHEHRPATLTDASNHAQQKTATKQYIQSQWMGSKYGSGSRTHPAIQQIQQVGRGNGNPGKGNCWFCASPGHVRRDCREYKQALTDIRKRNQESGSKATGSGRARGPSSAQMGAKGDSGN